MALIQAKNTFSGLCGGFKAITNKTHAATLKRSRDGKIALLHFNIHVNLLENDYPSLLLPNDT